MAGGEPRAADTQHPGHYLGPLIALLPRGQLPGRNPGRVETKVKTFLQTLKLLIKFTSLQRQESQSLARFSVPTLTQEPTF